MRNLLKRSRSNEPTKTSSEGLKIVELSSDSGESPGPPKRHKSTTPLLQHRPNAKADDFGSFSDGHSNAQTRVQSRAPGSQNASKIQHSRARLGSPLTQTSRKDVNQGAVERKSTVRSNGFQRPSRSQSPRIVYPPRLLRQAPENPSTGQPAKATVKDEAEDSDVQILRVTSKPLPPKYVPVKARPAVTPEPQHDRILRHQQYSVRAPLAHRPSPASPVPAVVPKPSSVNSPGKSTKFTLEVSLSQDKAPIRLREKFQSKKKKLFGELKKSVQPAIERIAEVEEYFGKNGFSANFSTDDTAQRQKAASKKLRHVDRSQVALDWGHAADADAAATAGDPLLGHLDGDSTIVHPVEQVRGILSARFNDEQYDPPITFANDINNRHLSGKFQFVNEYIINPGVKITDHRLDIGCSCSGTCNPSVCECLTKEIPDGPSLQIETYTVPTTTTTATATATSAASSSYYTNNTTPIITLSETFLANELDPASTKFEITECNENCGCSPSTCWNRVVERGRTVPLEIFQTATCGFGVRSPMPIIRGQFIELYLGEVITQEELERREDAKEEGASSYIFSLDFFKSSPGQECYHIDGEYFGTAMRFVNHSCSPNARSFTVVRGQKNDKRVHHVAFFAIRDIMPGEEICIDYRNDGQVGVDDDSEEDVQGWKEQQQQQQQSVTDLVDLRNMDRGEGEGDNDGGLVRCQCGAANCRKWLWPPIVRKRKRKQRKTLNNDGP